MKGYTIFNRINGIITFSCIFLLSVSCSKYGYRFDDGFAKSTADSATVNVDTSMSKPDYSMYSQAVIFPGVVDDSVVRLQNYKVDIDLNYIKNPDNLRISVSPKAWMSTGLYAPTGEPITIDVPTGVYGLTAQIGCWTDNLTSILTKSGIDALQREPVIYTVKQLFPGRNYIRSPFGGPIYIIPSFSQPNIVSLSFSGGCKMANYILGKTDPTQWKKDVIKSGVPWFEMIAPHIIYTLDREKAISNPIADPLNMMQTWEDVFNIDYSQWEGLSDTASNELDKSIGLPWRCVADIQPVLGYAHSGFPVVFQNDTHWFHAFTDYQTVVTSGSWGIIHEVGHNNQQTNWSFSNMGETTNNLFSFKVGNRYGFSPQATLWTKTNAAIGTSILNWVGRSSDTATKKMIGDTLTSNNAPIEMTLFYVQLFEKYGYGLMTELYRQTRHAAHTSNNDIDRIDFVYQVASQYAKVDLYVFFKMWGLTPSSQGRAAVAAMGLPRLNKRIWEYNPGTKTGGDTSF